MIRVRGGAAEPERTRHDGVLLSGNPEEGAVIGRVRPVRSAPGRARVVSRDLGLVTAQLLWTPPRA